METDLMTVLLWAVPMTMMIILCLLMMFNQQNMVGALKDLAGQTRSLVDEPDDPMIKALEAIIEKISARDIDPADLVEIFQRGLDAIDDFDTNEDPKAE